MRIPCVEPRLPFLHYANCSGAPYLVYFDTSGGSNLLVSDDGLPVEERHYDRKGRLARTMTFDDVRPLGGRRLPARMVLVPADAQGQRTEMRYLDVAFDVKVPDETFSLSRLERGP